MTGKFEPVPTSWVSIDPGDKHVGWCEWWGTECVRALHLNPEECVDRLEAAVGWPRGSPRMIEVVVYERWALYAWNEESMAGNEFLTSQLIGVIKYVCLRSGVHRVPQFASEGKRTYERSPWREWGIREWREALKGPIGPGEHKKDAYAHGANFLWGRGVRPCQS